MTRASNQEIERYYFEQFRTHYAIPDGEVEFTDKPDVVIRGETDIGIEIANLYLTPGADPASEQIQRVRRADVIERAQALHIAAGGRPIECWFDFEPSHPIMSVERVASAIARLIAEVQRSVSGVIPGHIFEHICELRFAYSNGEEYSDAKWRPVQSYSAPFLSIERVRSLVTEKVEKLKGYRLCDRYWLLLVVDFMDPAQDQDIRWPAGMGTLRTPFERVLIYKPQFGQVTEVPQ